MLGSDFYTYVLNKFKRTDKSTEAYQAMTDVIADMRLQMKSEDFKEEAYVTGISTLGDFQIGLPSDFGHIIGKVTVTDTDSDSTYPPLNKIDKQEYDELYPNRLNSTVSNRISGVPQHFCVYAKQLYIGPVPDKTTYKYQFNYTTEDYAEITAVTTNVPFSGKYRNILRDGVLWQLNDGLQNFNEANYYLALYRDGLSKIISNDFENTSNATDNAVQYNGV